MLISELEEKAQKNTIIVSPLLSGDFIQNEDPITIERTNHI